MRRNALIWLTLWGLALAASGQAYPQGEQSPPTGQQSFEGCGLITGEYLTVLQLLSRGLSPDTLKQSLPDISPQACVASSTPGTVLRCSPSTVSWRPKASSGCLTDWPPCLNAALAQCLDLIKTV